MVSITSKYNLLDMTITDMDLLKDKVYKFLEDAEWPRIECSQDEKYDTVYDLAYGLLDIWCKPVMDVVRENTTGCKDEFDIQVTNALTQFYNIQIEKVVASHLSELYGF